MTEQQPPENDAPRRRDCPDCGGYTFLSVAGIWRHWPLAPDYDAPIECRVIPPVVGICPDCGQPVTRDQPAWGPRGGPVHHDPCPIPPGA